MYSQELVQAAPSTTISRLEALQTFGTWLGGEVLWKVFPDRRLGLAPPEPGDPVIPRIQELTWEKDHERLSNGPLLQILKLQIFLNNYVDSFYPSDRCGLNTSPSVSIQTYVTDALRSDSQYKDIIETKRFQDALHFLDLDKDLCYKKRKRLVQCYGWAQAVASLVPTAFPRIGGDRSEMCAKDLIPARSDLAVPFTHVDSENGYSVIHLSDSPLYAKGAWWDFIQPGDGFVWYQRGLDFAQDGHVGMIIATPKDRREPDDWKRKRVIFTDANFKRVEEEEEDYFIKTTGHIRTAWAFPQQFEEEFGKPPTLYLLRSYKQ